MLNPINCYDTGGTVVTLYIYISPRFENSGLRYSGSTCQTGSEGKQGIAMVSIVIYGN